MRDRDHEDYARADEFRPVSPSNPAIRTQKPRPPKKSRRKLWMIIGLVFLLVIIGTSGALLYKKHADAPPFPKEEIQRIGSPFYYPTELPKGYKPQKNSFKLENGGIVFYSLANKGKTVQISEQELIEGASVPDLAHIEGFKKVTTINGDDVTIGTVNGQPTALRLANKTLITVTGLKGASKDAVFQTSQNMEVLAID